MSHVQFAFDRQSARSFDADGRMRVKNCILSTAEVNPYYGREVVRWRELGLDPDKVYHLYRDPEELARAADSFEGVPLMLKHIVQTAGNPQKEYQAGSVYNVPSRCTIRSIVAAPADDTLGGTGSVRVVMGRGFRDETSCGVVHLKSSSRRHRRSQIPHCVLARPLRPAFVWGRSAPSV